MPFENKEKNEDNFEFNFKSKQRQREEGQDPSEQDELSPEETMKKKWKEIDSKRVCKLW